MSLSETSRRLEQIVSAGNYCAAEVHDIAGVLCFIRDTDSDTERENAESLLRAFITRKKLNIPVNFKHLKEEFGCS